MKENRVNFLTLENRVRQCTECRDFLPLQPRPVFQIHPQAKILIVGQAPGIRVHETGIPFNDKSGERLRDWMGIDREIFYDPKRIALLPMAFCYPGRGKSGDLPPLPQCAEKWRAPLLAMLGDIQLTLVLGQYAHAWHLAGRQKNTLTETVRNWKEYWPQILAMPHPSPRNNIWLKKNAWFEETVVPQLRARCAALLGG